MTGEELLAKLHQLETEDPRTDPRNLDYAVWIWERDQVLKAYRQQRGEDPPKLGPRPPMGPLAQEAYDRGMESVSHVPLQIAVELSEAGYVVQEWPEWTPNGNLWECVVSDAAGTRYQIKTRLSGGRLVMSGLR